MLRVGHDQLPVDRVDAALAAHGDRYLTRIFTDAEVRDCRGSGGLSSERLAARFAAKEAVLKVLRPHEEAVPWRGIEVRRDPGGWVDIALDGPAAALAARQGVRSLAVSLTHEAGLASAVVVAEMDHHTTGSTR